MSTFVPLTFHSAAEKQAAFDAWLVAERFTFGFKPTPETMLRSPSSLTSAQRAWLTAHIAASVL